MGASASTVPHLLPQQTAAHGRLPGFPESDAGVLIIFEDWKETCSTVAGSVADYQIYAPEGMDADLQLSRVKRSSRPTTSSPSQSFWLAHLIFKTAIKGEIVR